MTMEHVYFSFRQTIFGVLKTLVVRAKQNDIDLMYDVDPTIPDLLVGDSLRLRQVITNLVGNAVRTLVDYHLLSIFQLTRSAYRSSSLHPNNCRRGA